MLPVDNLNVDITVPAPLNPMPTGTVTIPEVTTPTPTATPVAVTPSAPSAIEGQMDSYVKYAGYALLVIGAVVLLLKYLA